MSPGAPNPLGNGPGFLSVNPTQPLTSNEPEIIEIDDDDDEPVGEEGEEEGEEYEEDEEEEELEDDDDDAEIEDVDENEESRNGAGVNGVGRVFAPNVDSAQALDTPELFTSAGAQEALHPLRRTADRVTRQIEEFAEKLDRFKQKETNPHEIESFQAAYQLAQSYGDLTRKAIRDLSAQRTLKRAKLGWNVGQASKLAAEDPASKQVDADVEGLVMEAETWELLVNLISVDDPHTRARSVEAQKTAFKNLHRYSSDREIWEQFLSADHYALQCTIIMKWLEDTVKFEGKPLDGLIKGLETDADRGQGVWSLGWLYTKESIKGQKRLRAWPQPLDPNDPGLKVSLVNTETQAPLVTQLDPDAVTRQKQSLQSQDKLRESATWAICWKMLRKGENWTKIREWAHERLENWRAVSLCGSTVDANAGGETNAPPDDSTARMMNFRLQNSWRTSCLALARNQNADEYERAVYALLCGETLDGHKACSNWDDYVYVYLNSVLISRYQGFCKQFQRMLSHSPTAPVAFVPEPNGSNHFLGYLQSLMNSALVEARNPYRIIQVAIMSKAYDKFFYGLSKSVSRANMGNPERPPIAPDLSSFQVDEEFPMTAADENALRIASHLYVIVRSVGYIALETESIAFSSMNMIGYIIALEEAGIYDPIPLYASLLPPGLCHSVLGKILIDLVDPRERRQQVKLMEKHGIDVEAVLEDQWTWVWNSVSAIEHSRTIKRYPKVYTSRSGNRELAVVMKDYIGTDISSDDELIIRSLEWLRYIDGQWGKICELGAQSYRRFYISGNLAAARELSRRMGLSDISRKSFGFDIAEFPLGMEDGAETDVPEAPSPTKSKLPGSSHRRQRSSMSNVGVPSGNDQNILYLQSQPMRELEQLIIAFDALEEFANCYHQLAKGRQRRDSGTLKHIMDRLEESLNNASHLMDGMLDECLTQGVDEAETADLTQIRNTYIPELFLEYHNALYTASYTLSSRYLTQCMNLAVQVSDNSHLTRSFCDARRVAELVDALAISSKAIVRHGETREKTMINGETLGIWHVDPAGEQDQEFHEYVRDERENE